MVQTAEGVALAGRRVAGEKQKPEAAAAAAPDQRGLWATRASFCCMDGTFCSSLSFKSKLSDLISDSVHPPPPPPPPHSLSPTQILLSIIHLGLSGPLPHSYPPLLPPLPRGYDPHTPHRPHYLFIITLLILFHLFFFFF